MGYNTEKSRNKMEYINHLKKIAVIMALITVALYPTITWCSHGIKSGYIRNDDGQGKSTQVTQPANITEKEDSVKVRVIRDAIWSPRVGLLLGAILEYTTSQANKIRVIPALVSNDTEDRLIGSNMFIGF